MATAKQGLAQYFDISDRDRLNISFRSTTADKTMIFSGPPTFDMLGSGALDPTDVSTGNENGTQHIITPLAFSTNFSVSTSRMGASELAVIGSQETFLTPSNNGRIGIQLGAYSLVSGDPNGDTATTGDDGKKYTLVKRLYNDIISYDNGTLVEHFLANGKPLSASGFKPVAATADELFINFAHSEFYEMEFGIMRITLTKGNSTVLVTYYEHCKLQGSLSDSTRAGGQSQFQPAVSITSSREVPLTFATIKTIADESGSSSKTFMEAYGAYLDN